MISMTLFSLYVSHDQCVTCASVFRFLCFYPCRAMFLSLSIL